MTWTPHPRGDAERESAIELARAVIAVRDRLTPRARNQALSLAIWFYTEADGKYSTRYRSEGALNVTDKRLLAHEHVIPRSVLVQRMVAEPQRVDEIMRTAVGCVVLRTEHALLTSAAEGWNRYREAGVTVVDLVSGETLP